ncbi:hypothetical protein OC834_007328, partial [Tilletia horrida]
MSSSSATSTDDPTATTEAASTSTPSIITTPPPPSAILARPAPSAAPASGAAVGAASALGQDAATSDASGAATAAAVAADAARAQAAAEQKEEPELDKALFDALSTSRDRLFVLQSERDMIALLHDAASNTRTSLNMPLMNAYQRLLVHRCADLFGLGHAINPETKAVTLTVLDSSRIPHFRLAQRVPSNAPPPALSPFPARPSPSSEGDPPSPAASRSGTSSPVTSLAASSNTDGSNPAASSSSTSRSVSASASASSLTSNAPPNPPAFKIMRRDPSAPRLTPGMLALSASMAAANLDNGTGDALTSSTSSSSTTSHSQASTPNGSGNLTDPFAAQGNRGLPFPTTGASSTASSTASLVGTPTSTGGTIKKDRRNMTIEERE